MTLLEQQTVPEPGPARSAARARRRPSTFGWALVAITLVALAIRLLFALTVGVDRPNGGVDADRYHDLATTMVSGHGFSYHPARANFAAPDGASARVEPDGQHPPLHPALLGLADLLGFHSWNAHRVVASIVSALGVGLVGLAGRRLTDPAVGLVAASLAALHPLWFQHAGYLISEATFLTVVPLTMLAAARAMEQPTRSWRFALLGAAIALCALTRTEAMLFILFLGVPVALLTGDRRRLRAGVLVGLGFVVVLGPWMVRNQAVFGSPNVSFNGGITLAGSNCEEAYAGQGLGRFWGPCAFGAAGVIALYSGEDLNQAEMDRAIRQMATEYARDHASRLPVVALARVGRTAGVYRLEDDLEFDLGIGADRSVQKAGYVVHLLLAPIAFAGALVLAKQRRRRALLILAAGPLVSLLTAVSVYGATRMRAAAEPTLVILVAVAAVWGWRELEKRRADHGATALST